MGSGVPALNKLEWHLQNNFPCILNWTLEGGFDKQIPSWQLNQPFNHRKPDFMSLSDPSSEAGNHLYMENKTPGLWLTLQLKLETLYWWIIDGLRDFTTPTDLPRFKEYQTSWLWLTPQLKLETVYFMDYHTSWLWLTLQQRLNEWLVGYKLLDSWTDPFTTFGKSVVDSITLELTHKLHLEWLLSNPNACLRQTLHGGWIDP